MAKKSSPILWVIGILIAMFILGSFVYLATNTSPQSSNSCPIGKVCLSELEYKSLANAPTKIEYVDRVERSTVADRDYKVLNDPLYPPLNRTDARTHENMQRNVRNRDMYVPLHDVHDSYRLVGYLINQEEKRDMGGNAWKLFARQKDRHTSDFYMVPANNNYDIKIPIKDEMVEGTRLRDIYTIPNEVRFKSPMLNAGTYEFIENPKTDFSSSVYT